MADDNLRTCYPIALQISEYKDMGPIAFGCIWNLNDKNY